MRPATKLALKDFWRYTFDTNRVTTRWAYLTAFAWHIFPLFVIHTLLGMFEPTSTAQGGTFANSLIYMPYGVLFIPFASMTISRLRTMGRSLGWAFLLMIPWIGLALGAMVCLRQDDVVI